MQKRHASDPTTLIGGSATLRARAIERLRLENAAYYRSQSGTIVAADVEGCVVRFPNGVEMRARWSMVSFTAPQMDLGLLTHARSEAPNG